MVSMYSDGITIEENGRNLFIGVLKNRKGANLDVGAYQFKGGASWSGGGGG